MTTLNDFWELEKALDTITVSEYSNEHWDAVEEQIIKEQSAFSEQNKSLLPTQQDLELRFTI